MPLVELRVIMTAVADVSYCKRERERDERECVCVCYYIEWQALSSLNYYSTLCTQYYSATELDRSNSVTKSMVEYSFCYNQAS